MTTGQLIGAGYVKEVEDGVVACAYGAAALGVLGPDVMRGEIAGRAEALHDAGPLVPYVCLQGTPYYERLEPWVMDAQFTPVDPGLEADGYVSVIDLNDAGEMPLTEIADLLDSLGY